VNVTLVVLYDDDPDMVVVGAPAVALISSGRSDAAVGATVDASTLVPVSMAAAAVADR
jgi:hypothetical protein